MEKKENMMENKKFMFVPITFEEACDELKAGRHRAVYIENEFEGRLENVSKWGSRVLSDWVSKTTYYKKVEVTKGYIHAHPEDLEICDEYHWFSATDEGSCISFKPIRRVPKGENEEKTK